MALLGYGIHCPLHESVQQNQNRTERGVALGRIGNTLGPMPRMTAFKRAEEGRTQSLPCRCSTTSNVRPAPVIE
jgi:hypothetical protein